MSHSIIPTNFNSGVKRLRVQNLGAWNMLGRGLGDVSDDIDGMVAEGYDPSILNSLAVMGATDAELQNLWDNYGAGTEEFSDAAQALMLQLSAPSLAPPPPTMTTSAAGAAYGAFNSVVSGVLGTFDLSTASGWNALAGVLTTIQQAVNQAAAKNPQDPTVISQVQAFNSLVMQFATYYQTAVGSGLSSIPLASYQQTLSGIGDPNVSAWLGPLLGPIGDLINALYPIYVWAKNYITTNQQIAATTATAASTTASNVSALTSSYQNTLSQQAAAAAAGNPTLAAQLAQTAANQLAAIQKLGGATPSPVAASLNFTTWFEANWPLLMLGLGAAIIVPAVLKKI